LTSVVRWDAEWSPSFVDDIGKEPEAHIDRPGGFPKAGRARKKTSAPRTQATPPTKIAAGAPKRSASAPAKRLPKGVVPKKAMA